MSDRVRRSSYVAIVCLIVGVPIVASLFNLAKPFVPYGTFGFAARGDGTITAVLPSSAATAAGLKLNDRLEVRALSPQDRIYLHWPQTLAGKKAVFLLTKGPARSVTLVARPPSASAFLNAQYFAALYLLALSVIAIVLTAAVLALGHPSKMTGAFLIYAAGSQVGSPTLTGFLSPAWLVSYSAYSGVLWFGASVALVVFALRFPADRVRGVGALADRCLPWLAVAVAPLIIAANVALVYRGIDTDGFEHFLTIASTALYGLAVMVFVLRYFTEGRDERPRMAWVIASFLVGYSGVAGLRIWESVDFSVWPSVGNLLLALNIVIPFAVAYAIIKQRIISVRFFVNKALIFAVFAGVTIGGIALLDWFIAQRVEGLFSSAGTAAIVVVNVAAALALGFLMPWLYKTIRDIVDRYFFREQYRARQRMLQLAEELARADSASAIDEILVHSVAEGLKIGSVVVFMRGADGSFHRTAAAGLGDDDALGRLDTERLSAAFEAAHGALRLSDLHEIGRQDFAGDAAPVMGHPIFIGGKLTRFVLFSGHPHGLELDPSETRMIGEVTRAASHGFARLSQL